MLFYEIQNKIVKEFCIYVCFSDMLKNFIHEKDVKVDSLANYCKLERSTVYKFINEKREPMSAELVDRIAHFLKLTPSETIGCREPGKWHLF